MKRSDGEKKRLKHSLERMRVVLNSIEHGVEHNTSGPDDAQTILQTAGEIAMELSRLHAFTLIERDGPEV